MLSKVVLFLAVVGLSAAAIATRGNNRINTPEEAISLENAKKQQQLQQKSSIRPCHLNDYHCIADNLSANSRCNKQVKAGLPAKFTIPEFRFETPYFNSSCIDNNLVVGNADQCYVSEFYFNVEGDTAIIAIDCPGLSLESNRTLIQHYSLLEDTSYNYAYNGLYPLIRMTANLKHADHLDICSAFVFTDVTGLPSYKIDPLNKPTQNFLSPDLTFLNIFERETFFYRGNALFKDFVNANICDFGCSLYQ